eukprot:6416925-Amphidinium_carterae.1
MDQENVTKDQEQVIQWTGSTDLGCLDMTGELRVRDGVGHVILRPASGATVAAMKVPMAPSWTAVSTPPSSRATTEPVKPSATTEKRQLRVGEQVDIGSLLGMAVTYNGPKITNKTKADVRGTP